MKSIFLDTNVILDILDSKRENHHLARRLLEKTVEGEYKVTISEDMLSTIFYIIKNKPAVLHFFEAILHQWTVSPFGKETISNAIALCLKTENQDFEDTLQCLCAKKNSCNALITHDKNFIDCGIKILTIREFLDI